MSRVLYLLLSLGVWVGGLYGLTVGLSRADGLQTPVAIATICAFPLAALPMYTALALGVRAAALQLAALAIAVRLLPTGVPALGVDALASGAVAILLVDSRTGRTAVVSAGLWAGAVSALVYGVAASHASAATFIGGVAGSLLGGALSGAAVLTLSPLLESWLGHVTSLKLLEALSYDHPLLRRLISCAPGTFLHSTNLGILADAAARAIGADALTVRVGALYHDIGKTTAPAYFVENQGDANPHDQLPPEESARVLRQHVEDGVALIREHGLGDRIAQFAREHHGTSLMRYFADKAGRGAETDEAFHYPGPKPQSRETGLVMIADQLEATARTRPPDDLDRSRALVRETIDRIRAEGQLDESGLKAADLDAAAEAFAQVIHAIYHRRIAYPVGPPAGRLRAIPGFKRLRPRPRAS